MLVVVGLVASGGVAQAQDPAPAPANDNFAAAQTLTSGPDGTAAASGSNSSATRESLEPDHDGGPRDRSVWYRWVAPADGRVLVDTKGSDFDTVLAVYRGTSLDSLTPVASNDQYLGPQSQVRFAVTEGTEYAIAVAGWSSSHGAVKLRLRHGTTPANDSFAAARDLGQASQVSVTGDTAGASREPNEPSAASYSYGDASVWYSWTAPSSGALTVDTAGSSFNTALGVFTGDSVETLRRVASNDDAGGLQTSRATLPVKAGTTYRILVDGNSAADAGAVNLSLSLGPAPPNDLFALATPLPGNATVSAAGTNAGADIELGEPNPLSYDPGQASVWYSWTAPRSGSLTIRTTADFQPVITAYTGDSLAGLSRVPTQVQQAFNGGAEQVRIRVEAGVTYRIQIDGRYGATGSFALSLDLLDLPANDDFTNAIGLASELNLSVAGNNINATQQLGEPIHDDNYCDPSVWYTWTAPVSGGITLDTTGSEIRTAVGVYTGGDLASLTRVPTTRVTATGNGDLRFLRVEAGVTYRIAVDGLCGAMGNFRLALSFTAPPANDLFALATPLKGAADTAAGDLTGATGEEGEPNPGGSAGASVWYSWRAPSTGIAMVSATADGFWPGVQVYAGDGLLGLTGVPVGWSGAFAVEAGTLYRIAVHGNTRPDRGRFNLSLTHHDSPSNDDFADQEALEGTTDTATGDLRGATGEAGEPNPGGSAGASVWYSWRAPSTGTAVVRATGSSYPGVQAYTGETLAGLTAVPTSYGTFTVEKGTVYRIAVHGGSEPSRGSFSLSLNHFATPANDNFAAAEKLSGNSASVRGWTVLSTLEEGEYFDGSAHSVWYTWTAPRSGPTTIDVASEDGHDVTSGVYTGTGIDQRTLVRQDHHGRGDGGSRLTFDATEGTTYRIAIGSCGAPGGFRLSLDGPAAPPASDPPPSDPPATDPPASDPPPSDPPADDPPPSDPPPGPDASEQQQDALPGYWSPPEFPAPTSGVGIPLNLQAAFAPAQRVRQVLRRGFRGAVACSRDCSLRITVALGKAAGATRAPQARATLRAAAGPGRGFVVRLPKAVKRRLSRARSPSLTVRLVARSGSESRALTRRVRLRR